MSDRHTMRIECPNCNRIGKSDVVDSDPPSRFRREVESVSEGFTVKPHALNGRSLVAIWCDSCETLVPA